MTVEEIGVGAGLIWKALSEADAVGTKQLKKITKLKDKELYASLGWLAREGKVDLRESEDPKEILVVLVQD